ncbi:MAG: hypothetical protein M5U01_27585 [Ardenticatenaceae bacterium]|nr:hypothetical protein [Ardenticatenaceae bacterium]
MRSLWKPSVIPLTLVLFFAFGSLVLAQGATIQASENPELGSILTGSDGMTLYVFQPDKPGESSCYDQCAQSWPPLTVGEGVTPTAGEGVSGKVDVIQRTTGERQVTYNDMPLYYFVADKQPGDVQGQGVDAFGGEWYAVPPSVTSFDEVDEFWEKRGEQQAAAEATATPGAAMTATPGAAAQAATATPAAPATLPTTGGSGGGFSPWLVLGALAVGVLLIIGAFVVRPRAR